MAEKQDGGGRTALVTGGNRGLGLETCRQLHRDGYRVILTARDAADGEAVGQGDRRGLPAARRDRPGEHRRARGGTRRRTASASTFSSTMPRWRSTDSMPRWRGRRSTPMSTARCASPMRVLPLHARRRDDRHGVERRRRIVRACRRGSAREFASPRTSPPRAVSSTRRGLRRRGGAPAPTARPAGRARPTGVSKVALNALTRHPRGRACPAPDQGQFGLPRLGADPDGRLVGDARRRSPGRSRSSGRRRCPRTARPAASSGIGEIAW